MSTTPGEEAARGCELCGGQMSFYDTAVVLQRHRVEFHRCGGCGLIATLEPWWLDEAYSSAIYDGDTALLRRSRNLSTVTAALIRSERLAGGRFLDFGGGYGVLARLMRDKGHDFCTYDAYADNLLCRGFDGDLEDTYALVTAFEVIEHLADPVGELQKVAERNDRVFFTTQLQPKDPPRPDAWFYYALDSGQHVALHTERSLRILGERLGYRLTTNGDDHHLFHRGKLRPATKAIFSRRLARVRRMAARMARRGGG